MNAGRALCCALLGVLALAGDEARIDLSADGRAASALCATVSELLEAEQALDDTLLAALAGRELYCALRAADGDAAAQTLAHALDCWWVPLPRPGERRYTRAATLPPSGPLRARSYPSRLRHRPVLEDRVRTVMAPWLDGRRGLALHSPIGRWSATLDPTGHAELKALITRLERPEPGIPALIPHPDAIAPDARLERAVAFASWSELIRALPPAIDASVAISHALSAEPLDHRVVLHPATLDELPLQLTAQGIPSAWVGSVLCLGGAGDDRLHPALRRQWATIPVGHLVADPVGLTALIADLRRHAAPDWWQQPGAGLLAVEDALMLLVAADQRALAAVMNRLRQIDRDGGW